MESKIIFRHSAPTQLDECDHGTICLVNDNQDTLEAYIQINKENNPTWISVGKYDKKLNDKEIVLHIQKILNL